MVVNAELMQWAACNLVGKGYLLYVSDDRFQKTWMCSPGIPFWIIHPSVPRKKECLWYICTWATHTNNKLWWNTWKNCCLVTRERILARDIITYMGDMGGAGVKAHMVKDLYGTQGQFERDTVYILHSFMHSFMFKILVTAYSIKQPCFVSPVIHFKTETIRKLNNFNFQWTKTLYQNNLNNITLFFTFFNGCRYN